MIQKPIGTRDFLPNEMRRRRYVERRIREIVERWGYEEVKTPTFEKLELFTAKSGEEIVRSLYEFKDKGGRNLCLRPELTAPVVRMYLEKMKREPKPLKLYYFGNCFRYEEPQKARYREFWQFGVEVIGAAVQSEAEAEVVALADAILKDLGLRDSANAQIRIGHIGMVQKMLERAKLGDESKKKILKALDKDDLTKLNGDEHSIATDILGKSESGVDIDGFYAFKNAIAPYNVKYDFTLSVVRGLEYYTGMVFEIHVSNLGAESQICGGGSYTLRFNGEEVSSVGFAFGFDRVVDAMGQTSISPEERKVAVVTTEEARGYAVEVAKELREHFPTYLDLMKRSMKAQMSYVSNFNFVVIVGETRIAENMEKRVILRDMRTGVQETLTLDKCIQKIKGR
jgi:histidyl-tRNA synthetase